MQVNYFVNGQNILQSYLQGIEIITFRIVSTRLNNLQSYLQGIEIIEAEQKAEAERIASNRTYKELKFRDNRSIYSLNVSSNRTYKELKCNSTITFYCFFKSLQSYLQGIEIC